jgi:tetratricopeptide (TPR) repeat protein
MFIPFSVSKKKEISMRDERNLEVSVSNLEDLERVNRFYLNFIQQKDDISEVIHLAEEQPDCIPFQIYAALLHVLSQSQTIMESGLKFFSQVNELYEQANEREKVYIDALGLAFERNLEHAAEKYKEATVNWPRDILAGLMVEFHCFEMGKPHYQLTMWEDMKEHIADQGYYEEHHFWASYAFALTLNNRPEDSLEAGKRALSLEPTNPWAQHALSHAYARMERLDEGINLLSENVANWEQYGDFVRGHNYFHLALFFLEKGEVDNAFELYRTQIKRDQVVAIYQHSDILVFLWRARLSKDLPEELLQEIKEELENFYQVESVQNVLREQHVFPFLSLTYFYLCLCLDKKEEAEHILSYISEQIDSESWRNAKEIAQGLKLFSEGDYAAASQILESVVHAVNIGGSDEQRSVFIETYNCAIELKEEAQISFTIEQH